MLMRRNFVDPWKVYTSHHITWMGATNTNMSGEFTELRVQY